MSARNQKEAKPRVLAVASIGGHWIQLLRIVRPMCGRFDVTFCSTHPRCAAMVAAHRFHLIPDFNRKNIWRVFSAIGGIARMLRRERPEAVISTGAAPGLAVILVARLMGIRTIWVDSVANVEHPSACGKVAMRIASRAYTQWPHLAREGRLIYAGNVFGDAESKVFGDAEGSDSPTNSL